MASGLSTLASNLLTPDLKKLRETSKHFSAEDMVLVTRMRVYSIYPYEYTDSWEKLEETADLPPKYEFYCALEEGNI